MLSARIRPVVSRQNSRVKELRAALQRPGRSGGLIALEGEHLLLEGLRSGLKFAAIFVVEGFEARLEQLPLAADVEILSLPADILANAVTTETPQPLAALVHPPQFAMEEILTPAPALVIVAAGIQDPGNMGTLVRSAEAFGATGMVLLPGTTSLWNAKALRASSGSAFRLPVVNCDRQALLSLLHQSGVKLLAAVAHHAEPFEELTGPVAILIGNEGAGLSQEWIDAAYARITIPCPGQTESLNAAVAGSVLLYEASRQRALNKMVGR